MQLNVISFIDLKLEIERPNNYQMAYDTQVFNNKDEVCMCVCVGNFVFVHHERTYDRMKLQKGRQNYYCWFCRNLWLVFVVYVTNNQQMDIYTYAIIYAITWEQQHNTTQHSTNI